MPRSLNRVNICVLICLVFAGLIWQLSGAQAQNGALANPQSKNSGPQQVEPPMPADGEAAQFTAQILDAATGAGIPKATVELRRQPVAAPGPQDTKRWTYSGRADDKGVLIIKNMMADRYSLTATMPGYLVVSDNPQMITLAKKAAPGPMIFRMKKGPRIEGIVEDREGHPIVGARVEVLEEQWVVGMRTLALVQAAPPTDENGKYVFATVLPGSYYLRARPSPAMVKSQLRESDLNQDPELRHIAYVNTLYPSSQQLETASPFPVFFGADQTNVRIEVQKSRYFTVKGHVEGFLSKPSGQMLLIRTVTYDSRFPFIANSPYDGLEAAIINPDATFASAPGLPPGQYWAGFSPAGEVFGGVEFRVSDRDLEDVKAEVAPGVQFTGKIVYEDGTPGGAMGGEMRTFWDRRSVRATPFSSRPTGEFDVPVYSEGVHRLEFQGSQVVIRKIDKDGKTFRGGEFEINRGGGPAVITIARTGASIGGSVTLDKRTLQYPSGMVTLSMEPLNPLDAVKRKRLDGDTAFRFERLEPGRYRLCAWLEEGTEINRVLGNPSFEPRLVSSCKSVNVKADDNEQIELKQVSAVDLAR